VSHCWVELNNESCGLASPLTPLTEPCVKLQVSFEELKEHSRRKSRELARKAKQVVVMDCHTAAAEAVERLSSAEAVKAVCHKLEAAKHEEKTAAQRQEMCNASSWWRKEPHPHAAYVPPQRRSMDVVRSNPHPPTASPSSSGLYPWFDPLRRCMLWRCTLISASVTQRVLHAWIAARLASCDPKTDRRNGVPPYCTGIPRVSSC
jgi:hypothetical protein